MALGRVFSAADEVIPPFGLGYLAEAVRRHGHEVVVLDGLRERLREKALAARFKEFDPQVVGIPLFTKDLNCVVSFLSEVRRRIPSAKTVVGGPHPSAVPEETFSFFEDALDFAFVGESETGLPALLEILGGGETKGYSSVPGLAYRDGDAVRTNPRQFEENLDALRVAWDLIPPGSYPRAPHGAYFRRFPVAPVITTRGCPFRCSFCAGACVSGRKVRRRSVENIIGEIEMLVRRYGVREIHIEDDNFSGEKGFVLSFCDAICRKASGVAWTCPNGVRLDTLDREMLAAMKAAGLYFLSVGIESGSDRTLRRMKKSLTVEEVEEKVRLVHEAGIGVSGFFMLGFPGETREEMEETVRFALRLPLARASFANFQPFPGCEEFSRLRESGELRVDWKTFGPTLQSTTYHPQGVTAGELRRLRKKALWNFYSRPAVASGMVRDIRSAAHALWVLKRGWRWLTIPG